MQRVGEQPSELLVEDWNLFPNVYKNAVNSRRAAWRVITSAEQKEKSKGEEQLASHAREYVTKVEDELQKIRDGILALMDKELIPSPNTFESKTFYYKMKGYYYRHFAEFATGETKSKAGEDACVAYVEATKIVEKDLVMTHPVRLATALSSLDDVSVVAQKQILMVRSTRTLQCIDKVIYNQVVQVPQVQVMEKTVEIPQLHVVEKIVEIFQFQTGQSTQTFESLGTAPVCQSTQAEIVEAVEIEVPLPAESASLMSVTEPVLEVPPIVGKIDEIPEIRKDVGIQTSESLGTAPISQAEQVEIVEFVQIGTPVPAESGSSMFVKDLSWKCQLLGQRQALNIQTEQKTIDVPQFRVLNHW